MLSAWRDPLAGCEVWLAHRVCAAPSHSSPGPGRRATLASGALDRFLGERRGTSLAPSALHAAGGGGAREGFLLTVDDGTRDFAEVVLPLLERHDAHAILFVAPGFADGTWPPYEEALARLLGTLDRVPIDGHEMPLRSDAEREQAYELLRRRWKPATPSERRAAVESLARACGASPEADPGKESAFLDWRELRELDRHPRVTIGAHSLRHPYLPGLSTLQAREEIAGSKSRLEEELGHPIFFFAYPYGAHDRRLRTLVRRSGYRIAFATRRAPFLGSRRFAVPRRDLAEWLGGDARAA